MAFRARYGDVELLVVTVAGDTGRDWVVHSPTQGKNHVVQDRGERLKKTSLGISFCRMPGEAEDYETRFRAFLELVNKDSAEVFTHPIEGAFGAVVADVHYDIDGDADEVTVTCSIIPLTEPQAVFPIGAGVSPAAGPEEVGVTVDKANEQLAELELDTDVPAIAAAVALPDQLLAQVQAWANAETTSTRAVMLELASAADQIDTAIDALELLEDLERWELYRTFINLRYQMLRAAETVTAETARVLDYTVRIARPLRVIASMLYGAAAAETQAAAIAQLNGIKTPGLIPAGTVLKVPSTGARL